jgi:hypothetical protein
VTSRDRMLRQSNSGIAQSQIDVDFPVVVGLPSLLLSVGCRCGPPGMLVHISSDLLDLLTPPAYRRP